MAILGSDTFNRVGSTLGAGWTEHVGDGMATNMSTDGTHAIFDSAPVFHCATLGGTEAADHFVQCWTTVPSTTSNVCIVWRFIDRNNFYLLQVVTGTNGTLLMKRHAGTFYTLATFSTAAGGTNVRFSIRHIGNRIQVFLNQNYRTTGDGPIFDVTDVAGLGLPPGNPGPLVGVGPSGIASTGNVTGGIGTVKWNDFIARNGVADTIYVDTAFNGGAAGEGMGTFDRPDLGIDWALNNCGTEAGSTIKILSTGTITNAIGPAGGAEGQFAIGHAGRFNRAFTFPTYDDANGQVTDAGSPNLIIEGADGATRTTLQETRSVRFFNIRETARGIVIRGFKWRLTGGTASATVESGSTANNSFTIDKCNVDYEVATNAGFLFTGAHAQIKVRLCYLRSTLTGLVRFMNGSGATNIDSLQVRMNVFDARFDVMSAVQLAAGFLADGAGIINVGDAWDFDHNTFLEIRATVATESALGLNTPANVDGAVEFQNNIVFGNVTTPTSNGIYLPAGAITGSINAHHNGYFRVTTPRAAQVTNGGNEQDSANPAFVDPAASFTWQHTAGQGLLGEGTFAAIVIVGDFRPTSVLYVDTADDSNALLGVLDRGALQGYVLPPEPGPGGTSVPVAPQFVRGICPPDYCVRVTYDPGGLDLDLSNDLMEARPITQEKDIELRSYRANDIDLVIKDPDGRFILGSPNSIIEDAQGIPTWLSTPVTLEIVFNGTRQHIYRGFLIGVGARIGVADLRLGNRFESFVRKPVLANASGQTVSTDGSNGSQFDPPDSGSYLSRVIPNQGVARIETWTFRFLNATQFDATGSVTGFDGTGSTAAIFNSNSGAITVAIPFWVGVFAANDKVTVKTTLRIENTTTVQLLKTMLTSPLGADLDQSELDPSIDAYLGTAIDQPVFRYVLDSPTTVLEALENIGLHMLATVIEKADARIGLSVFVPSLSMAPLDMLCSGSDLIDLVIDTAPFYNFFVANFDWNEKEQEFTETRSFPADPADNDSQIRYDRLIPAPRELNLRAFNDTNVTWVQAILNQSYVRWSIPRPLHKTKLKVERMNMELDDLYVLDSLVPMTRREVEPFKISKDIDTALVEADLASADWYLQGPTECGYAFADVGHRVDDCWFVF